MNDTIDHTPLRAAELAISHPLLEDVQRRELAAHIVGYLTVAQIANSEWLSVTEVESYCGVSWDVAERVVRLLREKRAEMKEECNGNQD